MICMAGRHVKLIGIMSAACWPVPEPASPSNLASRRFTSFPWDTSIQPQRGWPCAAEKGLGFRAAGPSTVCCKDERRARRPFSVERSSARLPGVFSHPRSSHCASQASSETPGHTDRGSSDDFILVSKEDEGVSARGPFSGQAQPLRTLRSTSGRSEAPARFPLVFSDPLMGPASASSSNPSSSPDDDSSNNSKDSGFTIVSPLDICQSAQATLGSPEAR